MRGAVMDAGRTLAMGQDEAVGGGRPSVEAPFGKALARLGQSRPDIVGLTADLGKYTDILPFRDAFPERFFNVGMAEQNLVAVAAGLARTGKVPFATTYGVFATRRAYDFVAIALAHSNLNVKIVAGLPGLTTGYGGTHQAIEDLALMRMIPGLTIVDPCDATEIEAATDAIAEHRGPVYMRLLRASVPVVFEPGYIFEIGKARHLREGSDVGIISTGFMTERALDAADALRKQGISASVLHVPTIKPFDAEAVTEFSASVDRIVTTENHVVVGGLASLVVETLFDAGIAKKVTRIGLPDRYIECGAVPTLQARYGLTTEAIVAKIAALN
ncbi:transketolase family protein [Mesorhizobium australicum]|uniref:transketolase family protein n=1 Tax=Mesorhizobium australicum TaxID=536018 RepID=UPI00333D10BE